MLIGFLNTVDIEARTDLLDSAEAFAKWAHSLGYVPGDRARARALRDAIRASLRGQRTPIPSFAVGVHLDPGGRPQLAPADIAQAALAEAVELAANGDWDRVKLCLADDCLEAFYDSSRNRSRIWCDMAGCGNRAKVRRFRSRAAGKADR